MQKRFSGVYSALPTPLTQEGSVNKECAAMIVEAQLRAGVEGFFVCGSTGEGVLLDQVQRREMLEATIAATKGRAKIIAHIGALDIDEVTSLARHAEKAGADAIASLPPFYFSYSDEEIAVFYHSLAAVCRLPLFAYNFPQRLGFQLPLSCVKQLLEVETFRGIKHTDEDLRLLGSYRELQPSLVLFFGQDDLFLAGLSMGADGAIGTSVNLVPHLFLKVKELFERGQMTEALEEQSRIAAFVSILRKYGGLTLVKPLLERLGVPAGPYKEPLLACKPKQVDQALRDLKQCGLLAEIEEVYRQ